MGRRAYAVVAFEAAAAATLRQADNGRVTTLIGEAVALADAGEHYQAHTRVEQAERRLVELAR